MRVIIVDDESKSRLLLEQLCKEYCNDLDIVGTAASVNEAIVVIDSMKPDLVFLDIRMPVKNGFALLEYYGKEISFKVIFTTAYDQYALKAFQINVDGYLLKPIEIDELIKVVEKVRNKINNESGGKYTKRRIDSSSNEQVNKIALATTDGFTFVKFKEIIRCEAHGNYTYVYLADNSSLLITKTLKHYEEILPIDDFFRAHKSHLINLNFVRRFIKGKQGMVEMIDGKLIEVSLRKRERLLKILAS